MKKRFGTHDLVMAATIAALYAVFTVGIAPIGYGPIQFRVSEVLKVFVLYNPWLALGIGVGTVLANIFSPYIGPWELIWMPLTDMAGGVLAWFVFRILKRRHRAIPLGVYALTTGLAVATMLYVMGLGGFWFLAGSVFVSEALIIIGGSPLVTVIVDALEKRGIEI